MIKLSWENVYDHADAVDNGMAPYLTASSSVEIEGIGSVRLQWNALPVEIYNDGVQGARNHEDNREFGGIEDASAADGPFEMHRIDGYGNQAFIIFATPAGR